MLKNILMTLVLLFSLASPALASQIRFSQVIEDLPMMLDMSEKTDEAVVFDKPAGRIVEVTAETHYKEPDIMRFYTESLPALGWKILSPSSFLREGEVLRINVENDGPISLVHFNLTPKGQ